MAQDSQFEEWKKSLGGESDPIVYEVEKGHVRRFAEAIEDPNPLWQDEAKARKSPYGGIIAPPTLTNAFPARDTDLPVRRLYAGSESQYFGPIRAGDRVTVTSKLADLYQKPGRLGTMTFHVREVTYTNQFGEIVVKRRETLITY